MKRASSWDSCSAQTLASRGDLPPYGAILRMVYDRQTPSLPPHGNDRQTRGLRADLLGKRRLRMAPKRRPRPRLRWRAEAAKRLQPCDFLCDDGTARVLDVLGMENGCVATIVSVCVCAFLWKTCVEKAGASVIPSQRERTFSRPDETPLSVGVFCLCFIHSVHSFQSFQSPFLLEVAYYIGLLNGSRWSWITRHGLPDRKP